MELFKGPKDQLFVPLQMVAGIVEKRGTLPILSNVLIEKSGSALTFLATDIEIQMRTSAPCNSGEPVSLTVSARKMQDILRSLPEKAELTLSLIDRRLLLQAGRSRFSLQTLPAEEFPRMAIDATVQNSMTLKQGVLKRLISLVQYAMAAQDIRYYLNGLLLVVEPQCIRLVATDGHRLAYAQETLSGDSELTERIEVILPRKTILELARQLNDTEDPVRITVSQTQVQFAFSCIEMISKLIDGKFPDYERVIPKDQNINFPLQREEFLHAMQRVAIMANEKFRGIRLMLSKGSLKIAASNADQEEAQEEIEIDYAKDSFEVGFNVNYLLDVFSNVLEPIIECRLSDSGSSALFTLPEQDAFKYVVMPMRI
jgi:DNA polymerase-3 subunit beta